MRFVTAKSLLPGMVVGRNFYNNSMNIMLRKGVTLTENYIRSIRRININGLYIDDESTRDIIIKPLIDDELKLKFASEVKSIFQSVQSVVKPETGKIEEVVETIVEQISSRSDHVVSMFDLKSFDDYTFQHSIDVCILAAVLGQAHKLSAHLLKNLAISAVYHDIGMMFVDKQITYKTEPLTEKEQKIMMSHPERGSEYVKKLGITRNDVMRGVLEHHERYDGTGYPSALAGEQISLFGRIIALSDVFDA
ncbi:MAG: HD domain-containing protein, partial [Defluviitaleaceae bacterium]|nr:HD domain-containing protein [Defluviitaleaceae bacterium]